MRVIEAVSLMLAQRAPRNHSKKEPVDNAGASYPGASMNRARCPTIPLHGVPRAPSLAPAAAAEASAAPGVARDHRSQRAVRAPVVGAGAGAARRGHPGLFRRKAV